MGPTYQIKNWSENFEISQSKKVYKRLMWVAIPNKHDGKGFRRISLHPDCVEIFCAWVLIVQVASKMKTRGLLVDGDGPLDADDLARKVELHTTSSERLSTTRGISFDTRREVG